MEKSSIGSSSTTSRNDMMGFLSKFGDLAKTLASNVKEMYGMLEQAKDLFVEEETTGKMQHLIDNIWCKYTTKLIRCTKKYFKSNERQDDRMKALFDRMQQEMTTAEVTSFKSIQLVFFPVVLPDHYYLLCVNFVEGTFDLIDNRFLPPNIPFQNKYGNYHRLMFFFMF
ncbi:uncharacterized protein LOC110739309 [Chenopodium quinoa]|uniref:uncharacterized protein LOC110739309 n=1 Tax=Chenopodium quinoa TaxID=63459 RepID=UPI000B77EC26|nr:uncharacterized protein LOC110739309 [Chenopodium quinoa]